MVDSQNDGYYVDFVMCVDATCGMSPILDEVKKIIVSICDMYIDTMEETDREIAQLRVKVIVFRKFDVDDDPIIESGFYIFPKQKREFNSFVKEITAVGGDGKFANALEAIALALKSEWTTEGGKRRHIVFVFTNNSALELIEQSGNAKYPYGMPSDFDELESWWEGTDSSKNSTYQAKAGRLVAITPNADPWTKLLAWNRCWIAFLETGTEIPDLYIQQAIDLLVGDIL